MLTLLYEPVRVILAYFESLAMFLGGVFGAGQAIMPHGDYLMKLNCTGVYANLAQYALPQTAMHGIVAEHFARKRSDGKTPKCLVIGYDGARADLLVHTKGDPRAATQAVKAGGGKIYAMYCGGDFPRWQNTVTCPGWTTLLTGHWADERGGTGHGIHDNGLVKAPDTPKLLFNSLFDQKLIQRAALVVAWKEFFSYEGAVWYNDKAYAEQKGYNAQWLNVPDDESKICAAAKKEVQNPAAGFVMAIFNATDHAGHDAGFGDYNPKYIEAFKDCEHYGYALIEAVKARPAYAAEDWLIIVTTDHGGWRLGHWAHWAVERQIFMAVNKDLGRKK